MDSGLDGPSSFIVVLGGAAQAAFLGAVGMSRVHDTYFLVCGAGDAAVSTFQARLTAALKSGKTLDQVFAADGPLGGGALRRATAAGSRNRAMILAKAASLLGIDVDSLNDSASAEGSPQRVAIPIVDVSANVLRKDGMFWQFSTCCDSGVSTGLCSLSSATEGLILFADREASLKTAVNNEAGDCVPFATPRLRGPRALVMRASEEAHPDARFIEERFAWTEKQVAKQVVPPSLWGRAAGSTSRAGRASWGGDAAAAPAPAEAVAILGELSKLRAVAENVGLIHLQVPLRPPVFSASCGRAPPLWLCRGAAR